MTCASKLSSMEKALFFAGITLGGKDRMRGIDQGTNMAKFGDRADRGVCTVAVIIPTYNRAGMVVQAVDSALGQTHPPDLVIVVDDGSTDGTGNIIARYGDRVQYLRQNNTGKPAALNRGMAEIDADYVLILDDDDVLLPDALERHLEFLASNPSIDFTYSGCYSFTGDRPSAQPDPALLYDTIGVSPADFFVRCLETFPFHEGGMLVPLSCYQATGPFDESLVFGEDYEMILRLVRHWEGGKLPQPTFLLRRHAGLRGPGWALHAASDRAAAWRVYEKKTFARLGAELTLDEYLPRVCPARSELEPRERRQALLQRACVMARHGLFDEALEDLTSVFNGPYSSYPFTSSERRICNFMFDLEPGLLQGKGRWLEKVSQLFREKNAMAAFEAGTAGLFWSLNREWRHKSWHGLAILAASLLRFGGVHVLPMMIKRARVRLVDVA